MRRDVTALLEKLGRRDFRYEAFADPISDLEPWPLFAALLEDPRVVGRPQRIPDRAAPPPGAPMFARYGGATPSERGATSDEPAASRNLRAFLSGLSDDHRGSR
ncbi:hypothetical protein ASG37_04515 [Sphingomonas sp. Leaf407]|uniref:hypothetical protein n=1 Tax=unclassified Sphingomonas TaxID=196159 RepID=UPI000700F6D4|nr:MULTISPECIES: hypothetical protein [unclassified Sphingomonas]KQN36937.1 hypothetical protein ASE97_10430 [Sphingomonas sp. Leaf42]KQT30364.1 hypothetical protein ASG37_04515 [Sphingomonas sp. Leaf407]